MRFSLDLIYFSGAVVFVHFRHDSAYMVRAPLISFSYSLQGVTQVNLVLRLLRSSVLLSLLRQVATFVYSA